MSRETQKPSRSATKAAETDAAAREIIARDHQRQDEKTAKLRAAREQRDAARVPNQALPSSDTLKARLSEHARRESICNSGAQTCRCKISADLLVKLDAWAT